MKNLQACMYLLGVLFFSFLIVGDVLVKAFLNPFGIIWPFVCFVIVTLFYSKLTETRERAMLGAHIIGAAFIVPLLKLALFSGNSMSQGRVTILLIIAFFAQCVIASSSSIVFEEKVAENEELRRLKDEEDKKRLKAEQQAIAWREYERQQEEAKRLAEEQADLARKRIAEEQAKLERQRVAEEQAELERQILVGDDKYGGIKATPEEEKQSLYASDDSELLYFVKVKFPDSDKTYDYLCTDMNILEGDVVRVRSRGRTKSVTVVDSFFKYMKDMPLPSYRYKYVICPKNDDLDYDEEEIARKEEEEFRRDMEEDARRRAIEEEEEWREIRAEEARQRREEAIWDYQAYNATSFSSPRDDDWDNSWARDDYDDFDGYKRRDRGYDDDDRIYDSRGFAINGKLREYERQVRKTGIADTEYELELKDGYRYCDDHEEYDDCHYGHDDDSYESDDSYDDSYDSDDSSDNRDID